jgi:hypothetical protein
LGGAAHPTIPERIVTIRKLGPEPDIYPSRTANPKSGQSPTSRRKNLPKQPTQIANLEIGLKLKIESHGMTIPWLSSL